MKSIFGAIAIAATAVFSAGVAQAATVTVAGSGATDVDQIAGTSHTLNVGASGAITDLNVAIELGDGGGLQWGDLDIFLVHNGVSVQLLDFDNPGDCCSASDPFNVVFDDSAISVLGTTGAVGTFQPQNGSLADFNSLDVFGEWELQIFERTIFENETDLIAWSITAEINEIPIPPAMILFAGPLAGFAAMRRRKRARQLGAV